MGWGMRGTYFRHKGTYVRNRVRHVPSAIRAGAEATPASTARHLRRNRTRVPQYRRTRIVPRLRRTGACSTHGTVPRPRAHGRAAAVTAAPTLASATGPAHCGQPHCGRCLGWYHRKEQWPSPSACITWSDRGISPMVAPIMQSSTGDKRNNNSTIVIDPSELSP